MATEKRIMERVVSEDGSTVQVLFETSADQVTLEDADGNYTADNVEGALNELAAKVASAGKVDDVQDVNGNTIVTNKIAKLSKAAVGLGNVDNTADANKSVKYATEAGKATNDAAGNKITDTYATKNELREGLAGKANTKTYDNYQAFVTAMGLLPKSELKVGDNIYIKKLDVPDMWVTAVNATSASYTYTNDQAIINALNTTNGLTVGYFSFSKLETEKVDLSSYQTKNDNSLVTSDKTVVGAVNEVYGLANQAGQQASANTNTLDNIINNGTQKVKNAGHADSAAFADEAGNAVTSDVASELEHSLQLGNTDEVLTSFSGIKNTKVEFYKPDFHVSYSEETNLNTFYVELSPTGVAPGTYSAVTVDHHGRVTAGSQIIEWGTSGQTKPTSNLVVGGLFMKLKQ